MEVRETSWTELLPEMGACVNKERTASLRATKVVSRARVNRDNNGTERRCHRLSKGS